MAGDIQPELFSDPLADPIVKITDASKKLKILGFVLEMGLFDELEQSSNWETVPTLAIKLGYDRDALQRILNTLVCFKLLDKKTTNGCTVYHNTPATSKYLISSKKPSLIHFILSEINMVMAMYDTLPAVLRQGTTDNITQVFGRGKMDEIHMTSLTKQLNRTNLETMKVPMEIPLDKNQNPVPTNDKPKKKPSPINFMLAMNGFIAPTASMITKAFDLSGHKSLLDLGGGSGYLASEFVRVYPGLKAMVFDLPDTIKIARLQQDEEIMSNVLFVEGDFFKDNFPPTDLIVLSHVIHNWERNKVDVILDKAFNRLPCGGEIIIAEKFLNEDKTGPETSILFDLSMCLFCKGRERTQTEYRQLLHNHGFRNIEAKIIEGVNYHDVIIGRKPF
ncbi:acetylserotonin O-methyltransferase [Patella vulgata]|uniref:acetylserotonin O-methyltransferase n=1 Tax=Patella vulgata TaxID=6465 RepID=UPI0021806C84|nr:acetylserotonin O-methyltransferase [Patella vulgata]